jgi:hypothetical protein
VPPEEILLRIVYRNVNAERASKSNKVLFRTASSVWAALALPGITGPLCVRSATRYFALASGCSTPNAFPSVSVQYAR